MCLTMLCIENEKHYFNGTGFSMIDDGIDIDLKKAFLLIKQFDES